MTVLEKNAATGVDLGQLGRAFGKVLAIGAIVVGAVFAVNSSGEPQGLTTTQFEAPNALNKADGAGVPEAAFTNKADVVLRQRGAELAGASSAAQPTSSVAGSELADKIEGYPSPSASTKPESKPATSRNFGTQEAK